MVCWRDYVRINAAPNGAEAPPPGRGAHRTRDLGVDCGTRGNEPLAIHRGPSRGRAWERGDVLARMVPGATSPWLLTAAPVGAERGKEATYWRQGGPGATRPWLLTAAPVGAEESGTGQFRIARGPGQMPPADMFMPILFLPCTGLDACQQFFESGRIDRFDHVEVEARLKVRGRLSSSWPQPVSATSTTFLPQGCSRIRIAPCRSR